MSRLSIVWIACFLALVAAIPVAGQNIAGPAAGQLADRMQRAIQAEQIVAAEEAALGRVYDASYRSTLVRALSAKSSEALYAVRDSVSAASVVADAPGIGDSGDNLVYTPVVPCRIIDTRLVGGAIPAGGQRAFLAVGTGFGGQGGNPAGCGIPFGPTTAVVINFVAVGATAIGDARVWPFGSPVPLASLINYVPGANVANGPVSAICNPAVSGCGSDIVILSDSTPIQIVADVMGYFSKPTSPVTQNLFAVVNSTKTLARGFRVTSVGDPGGTGEFEVIFDRDVTNCSYVAGIGLAATSGTGPAGFVNVVGRGLEPNGIYVQTFNTAGVPTNLGFHVNVMCPGAPSTP